MFCFVLFVYYYYSSSQWDLETLFPLKSSKISSTKQKNILYLFWGSSSGDLGSVKHPFIVINTSSTLNLLYLFGFHLWFKQTCLKTMLTQLDPVQTNLLRNNITKICKYKRTVYAIP